MKRACTGLVEAVERCIRRDGRRSWLIAFSGGPDSTALSWAFLSLRRRLGLRVQLAHIDHGLDAESTHRAERAADIAQQLDLPLVTERLDGSARPTKISLEAWARDARYTALARVAHQLDCQRIATGHHADDQAETVLLRLAFGSGLRGLAGIQGRRGNIVRPFLTLRRHQIESALAELSLEATVDSTNRDLSRPRNLIRHQILPEWEGRQTQLVRNLLRLSDAAGRAHRRLDTFFVELLNIQDLSTGGASLERRQLTTLPNELFPPALSALEWIAEKPLPTSTAARSELQRQLRTPGPVGCDAGTGWRWQADGRRLRLLPPRKPLAEFTYTVQVPGSVFIAEIGFSLRIAGAPFERPAIADQAVAAYLRPPSSECRHVEIRNRRPGDRLTPAGRHRERRLKELLIDQRIPRDQRDRLPLVVIGGRVAWIPGIALDEHFRARDGEPAWLVELLTHPAGDLIDDKR